MVCITNDNDRLALILTRQPKSVYDTHRCKPLCTVLSYDIMTAVHRLDTHLFTIAIAICVCIYVTAHLHYTLRTTVRSTSFEGYSSSSQTSHHISGIKKQAPPLPATVSASDADAISAMLALAGATMTTTGSSSMITTTSSSMITTTSSTNDDTETRPLKRARNNSGSSGSGNAEPNVSFAIPSAVHHTSKDATAQATSAPAVAAGTAVKRRSSVLLHSLAHNLVAEHPELYATATASRQANISTNASTITTSGSSQQHGAQQQRATPSPVPSSIASNSQAAAAAPAAVTAVPIPMSIPATATVTTALPEGQKLANGGAKIDVPLEENRYLCHIPQWAAALARQPKIAAPRPVAAFEKLPGQTLVRTTNQPPAVIGDKGLRSMVDLDLNINQHEPDPWQSQQVCCCIATHFTCSYIIAITISYE
jgi:hypothetical protein